MTEGRTRIACVMAILALISTPGMALAQRSDSDDPTDPPVMTIEAGRLRGSIEIDGDLNDEAWQDAVPATGFIQSQPVEGDIAEQQTEVRVLFGDDAIYVAARMFDTDPLSIANQLVRRDGSGQFDYFQFALDPNLDQRTGYVFQVSAANVQRDVYIYNDERTDVAWNAVWTSAVQRDGEGWTAELRIPLSQIRYELGDRVQTWGVNFGRRRVSSNETSFYAPISRLRRGLASQFGLMRGVQVSKPSRRVEVRPYVLSASHTGPSLEGDPFFDGSESNARAGMEISYGIGANFTLDATVSPDFGQVEADPAVINLSAFETFLQERRPFFVEDARVFDFSLSGRQNQLFYSRRIGRAPQGRSPVGATFTDRPTNATILGAAKFSGRTASGLSIGVLGAVTDGEKGTAFFSDDGRFEDFLVEPRTTQGVVRVQQDFGDGASQIGGIFTAMNRSLPGDGSFGSLTEQAYNAGLDFEVQWGNREWALYGFFAASNVRGDSTAITRIQRSSNHYFQRPDATRLSLDPQATSLTGAEWRLTFERRRGDHWTGSVWAAEVTPGFEINDLGFSRSSERLDAGARVTYREIIPGSVFRKYDITFLTFQNWSHEALDNAFSASSWRAAQTAGTFSIRSSAQFLNWWDVRVDGSWSPQTISRTATRGGPLMMSPGSFRGGFRVSSDRRSALSFGMDTNLTRGFKDSGQSFRAGMDVTFRPSPRMELRVRPGYSAQSTAAQYVASTSVLAYAPTFGNRYLFADLDRRTVSMETRLNVSFTPNLTLELFAQPLIAAVDYVSYKQLAASGSFDFNRFTAGDFSQSGEDVLCSGGQICRDGDTQFVDFDGDGASYYAFSDRDFNQRSIVGNAVVRWEYRPGSTIFFVWQRSQFGRDQIGDFAFGRDVGALFDVPADNRFIVKVNYWLGV
jgi:Domain of unknown function (DUF5916)/Carbohydrate family 9 binding domain-like